MGISLGGGIFSSVFANQNAFTQQQIEALRRQADLQAAYDRHMAFVTGCYSAAEQYRGDLKVIDGECVEIKAEEPKLLEYKPK